MNYLNRSNAGRLGMFIFYVSATALVCQWSGSLTYFAPFVASAAVLANAAEQWKKVLAATVCVYLISIAVAVIGAYLLPLSIVNTVLCCAVGHGLCILVSRHHPPALALLVVLFMRLA